MSSFKEGLIHSWERSGNSGLIFRIVDKEGSPLPPFIPGQYTALSLDPSDPDKTRAYSICSSTDEPFWEFLVTLVPGGYMSENLLKLKKGDTIFYRNNPKGQLILSKLKPNFKSAIFVGTGSGIGPFRSMLLAICKDSGLSKLNLTLLQGARYSSELHYHNDFQMLSQKLNLDYRKFISREVPSSGITNAVKGRVTDFFTPQTLQNFPPDSSVVFLCGNPSMIDDVSAILEPYGFSKEASNLVLESYW